MKYPFSLSFADRAHLTNFIAKDSDLDVNQKFVLMSELELLPHEVSELKTYGGSYEKVVEMSEDLVNVIGDELDRMGIPELAVVDIIPICGN